MVTKHLKAETNSVYEQGGKHRLISRETKTYENEDPENNPWTLIKKELISQIVYRCDDLLRSRTIETWEYDKEINATGIYKGGSKKGQPVPIIKRMTNTVPPFSRNDLVNGKECEGEYYTDTTKKDFYTKIQEEWEEKRRNLWQHTIKVKKDIWELVRIGGLTHSGNPLVPSYRNHFFAWENRVEVETTKDEEEAPSAEFRPSNWDFESQERESEIIRSPGRLGTRVRRILLPYPTGATRDNTFFDPCGLASDIAASCDAHLDAWASLWDILINHQARSRQFVVPYTDTLRECYHPFQVFTAEHLSSNGVRARARYFINGFSLQLTQKECLCLLEGVWLADEQ